VNIDYHVEVDHHWYSVPYQLTQQEVEIRATAATVEVFHKGIRVASHSRSHTPHRHTTLDGHRPPISGTSSGHPHESSNGRPRSDRPQRKSSIGSWPATGILSRVSVLVSASSGSATSIRTHE
jgi:hypothetical protein